MNGDEAQPGSKTQARPRKASLDKPLVSCDPVWLLVAIWASATIQRLEPRCMGWPRNRSAPVRTDFGFHLIKLLGVEAPEVPTPASLKDKLTRELKPSRSSSIVEATTATGGSVRGTDRPRRLGPCADRAHFHCREGGDGERQTVPW
jgi:hypothetical protein